MLEYKWCVVELRNMLLETDWVIDKVIEPKLKGYHFKRWIIKKERHQLELELYHVPPQHFNPIYSSDLLTYACNIKGTDISLGFLEYYQKKDWMDCLQRFVQSLNYNYNLVNFGGHALKYMPAEEAIEIATTYIKERPKMSAKVNGINWSEAWIDGHHNINSLVWIVTADNLDTGPFIDGVNTYHIVINIKNRQVEDVRLT